MNFDFTDDQHQIKRTARELLHSRSAFERVRGAAESREYDPALWRELCGLGWPGIALPEEHGGQGLGSVELVILLEELGYACAAVPFLSNALAGLLIAHAGDDAQRARWLPGIASGEEPATVAIVRDGGADLVLDAERAAVIVAISDGGATLVERSAAEVEPVEAIDLTRRHARVRADGGEPLGGDVPGALNRAEVAVAAELVGLGQRALDMTVEFVNERKQFGVPVGSFQAVSHRAAQMLLDTEGARSATYFAAWAADADPERLAMGAAMAKAAASDAGRSTTGAAIQLHGGIGFTWEADLHWLYKRAQIDSILLGGAGEHRRRVAALAARTLSRVG